MLICYCVSVLACLRNGEYLLFPCCISPPPGSFSSVPGACCVCSGVFGFPFVSLLSVCVSPSELHQFRSVLVPCCHTRIAVGYMHSCMPFSGVHPPTHTPKGQKPSTKVCHRPSYVYAVLMLAARQHWYDHSSCLGVHYDVVRMHACMHHVMLCASMHTEPSPFLMHAYQPCCQNMPFLPNSTLFVCTYAYLYHLHCMDAVLRHDNMQVQHAHQAQPTATL